jgi:hypothetical protein
VAGRSASDIASAFWNFLVNRLRDKNRIILWADNCSAQNKNWLIFTVMTLAVNSPELAAESIEIKYLVAGHTFMSAGSVHHQIENGLKKHGDVCDWIEFKEVLKKAKCDVFDLQPCNFYDFVDGYNRKGLSQASVKLNDMSSVKFTRGCRDIGFSEKEVPLDIVCL